MQETVTNEAGFVEENSPVLGDAGQEPSVAELLGVEQQQEPEGTVIKETGGDGQKPVAQTDDQTEKNRVYAGMERSIKARLQKQFDSDPEVAFARKLIDYYAQARGLERKDAVSFAEAQFLQAVATMENVSPNVARMLYQKQQPAKTEPKEETREEMIARRSQEIHEDLARISLPEGFDFSAAAKDEAFAQMLLDMPTEAAIRVYHAEQQAKNAKAEIAEQLRVRANLPAMTKPQQPVAPKIDFNAMTDEEFFEFDRKMKG